jgi:phosphohistidine phosphatase
LYLATPATLLATIQAAPSQAHTLLVIGHNPGLHAIALELVGAGDRKLIASLAKGFPTASLAVLTFESEKWSEVRAASGRIRYFVTPKQLA